MFRRHPSVLLGQLVGFVQHFLERARVVNSLSKQRITRAGVRWWPHDAVEQPVNLIKRRLSAVWQFEGAAQQAYELVPHRQRGYFRSLFLQLSAEGIVAPNLSHKLLQVLRPIGPVDIRFDLLEYLVQLPGDRVRRVCNDVGQPRMRRLMDEVVVGRILRQIDGVGRRVIHRLLRPIHNLHISQDVGECFSKAC